MAGPGGRRGTAAATVAPPGGRAAQRAQARPARAHEWTAAKRGQFLETLARTLNISASARAAGMSTVSARALKRRDPGFAEAWAEAMLTAYDELEMALVKRAIKGTLKPVWHGGKRVGSERVFNDGQAHQLLTQHRATVMRLRGERPDAAPVLEPEEVIRARLIARFESMEVRLSGGAGDDAGRGNGGDGGDSGGESRGGGHGDGSGEGKGESGSGGDDR
ncbi:hypothetical protein ACMT1E_11285 [Sphingomonas flavalba]|uniref:hypothetical protein n=1 Tax=Sphingomonas flavalba TaxID=2559804 RepID=UPI0039DF42A6